MKLDKLLKSNIFLINSSICLVVLLMFCYLGTDSSIKGTYSLNIYNTVEECNNSCSGVCTLVEDGFLCEEPTYNSIIGMYRWNEKITDYNGVLADFDLDVNFISGGVQFNKLTVSFQNFLYDKITYSATNAEVILRWKSGNKLEVDSVTPSSLEDKEELLKTMYFNKEVIFENADFYNWFMENVTPDEKCYYNNTTGKFIFSNLPTSGFLVTDAGMNTKESCETNTATKFAVIYNNDGATDTVYVDIGTAVTLPNASKEGYNFKGWYTSATDGVRKGGFGETFTPTEDITLYAQWEEEVIDIDFGKYKEDGKYVIVEEDSTKTNVQETIKLPKGYTLKITTINNQESVNTGAKIEILKSDNSVYGEYTAVILGDVNGDGIVYYTDYVELYYHVKGSENGGTGSSILTGAKLKAADMNEDGKVNFQDYVDIYYAVAKQGGNN